MATTTQPVGEIGTLFIAFRDSLDQHYDTKERIVKASRDITALSKKLIFTLHRLQAKNSNAVLNEAKNKKKDILALFQAVSVELEGMNFFRYIRSISPAIQEYVEATSFLHYLEHKELVAKEQVEKDFRDAEGRSFLQVTEEDYIFGIADLTGELMRLAINSVGNGNHEQALEVCQFLRSLKGEYGIITVTQKSQLGRKLEVMKSSLIKVEDACYAIRIRGSEYPPEMYQDIIRSHQARYDEGEGGEAVYGDD